MRAKKIIYNSVASLLRSDDTFKDVFPFLGSVDESMARGQNKSFPQCWVSVPLTTKKSETPAQYELEVSCVVYVCDQKAGAGDTGSVNEQGYIRIYDFVQLANDLIEDYGSIGLGPGDEWSFSAFRSVRVDTVFNARHLWVESIEFSTVFKELKSSYESAVAHPIATKKL